MPPLPVVGIFIISIVFTLLKGAVKTSHGDLSEDVNLPMMLGPNITGTVDRLQNAADGAYNNWGNYNTGAFSGNVKASKSSVDIINGSNNDTLFTMKLNASLSNPIYGNSQTVQPKSLNINILIKY